MSAVRKENEPLAGHTVFRIGGPARVFIEARNSSEFLEVLREVARSGVRWCILGAGSNVLISDRGFGGSVIHPSGGEVRRDGERLTADAAVPMARVVHDSLLEGLRGFEWAIGVPGTIGGSVVGNAGCFGSEMRDMVESVRVFNAGNGAVEDIAAAALEFRYRESMLKHRPELVVLQATLRLTPGDRGAGEELVRGYTKKRVASQDIGSSSAGCMFKNISWDRPGLEGEALLQRFPELAEFESSPGIPAGFLIDRVGLKGRRVGRVRVSERHGNFFINEGGASAEEVLMLIGIAKEYVHRRYGLLLEEEIRYVGFEDFVAERKPRETRKAI